ncbi:MAG: response regulator [Thermodesulfobacteriota bacterium]|jgi:two-component system cell cycle response regulator DivK
MQADQPDSKEKKKILVVDDNQDSRELVMKILGKKNYHLLEAYDGEDALNKIMAEKPDLVLMDISMPKIDGYEVTRRLKAMKDFHDITIIALTAHAMKGDCEKALAAGCKGYITKPINIREFSEQIKQYLR